MSVSEINGSLEVDQFYHFDQYKSLYFCDVPEAVREVRERADAEYQRSPASHFQQIVEAMRPPAEAGGPPYAIFEDIDSSEDTALVVPLPFCNPITPDDFAYVAVARAVRERDSDAFDSNTWNNGEKHQFLFEVMKALDIRDEAGKTIPVIAVPGDSQDYQPQLDAAQRKALRQGDLSVYAQNIMNILQQTGHGQLHIGGYSQGASVAHQLAAKAHDFDVASLTLAEAPTYKDRSALELAKNYLLNQPTPDGIKDPHPESKWTVSGPKSRQDLEHIQNKSFQTMAKAIVKNGAWRAALALRHATLETDVIEAAVQQHNIFPLTLAWNQTSSLTHDIEAHLNDGNTPLMKNVLTGLFADRDKLRLVKAVGDEAVGAPHLAGESPMFYSLLFGESVKWATERA